MQPMLPTDTIPKKKTQYGRNPFYDLPFYSAFATTTASFLLNFLSFSSPYWLESYPETNNPFLRLGLWSVCFNKYIHPKDNFGLEWTGCYWIFDWNLWNKGLWEYIDPPWFIGVQVMVGLGFIMHCITMVCLLFHFLLMGTRSAESAVCGVGQAVTALFLFIGVVTFGIKVDDRTWMPRPDHNHLSWSYAFACISCFVCLISCSFLYIVYKNDKEEERLKESGSDGMSFGYVPAHQTAMSAAGSVYAAGAAQPHAQPTMSMRSGFSYGRGQY